MMVTFVSQCEKRAIKRTQRVLDAFADRIGDRTWQTVMTEEGLLAVRKLLRKTATKNTAVSCHWLRSRSRSDLVWIVGNRQQFDAQGRVAVNHTEKSFQNSAWENNWYYLPLIKALAALAALLHDWGKANTVFQAKLTQPNKLGDPLRHEWVSCLLLQALVTQASADTAQDANWLQCLETWQWDEQGLQAALMAQAQGKSKLSALPPAAQLLAWLIVSHHRLPDLKPVQGAAKHQGYAQLQCADLNALFKRLTQEWGYHNLDEGKPQARFSQCFAFEQGLLSTSEPWKKQVQKWAGRLQAALPLAEQAMQSGAWRVVLHHARLCLMLGDHHFSSLEQNQHWQSPLALFANTGKDKQLKQKLDEHLCGVAGQALSISQSLQRFESEMDVAHDVRSLKQKSPAQFAWQDKAVQSIQQFRAQHNDGMARGWFVVNMASTGQGKTIANAKIMRALSDDANSLRYVLALGLRTLTLQTGDAYRDSLGMGDDELAVLIGSKAVLELHQQNVTQQKAQKTQQEDIQDTWAEYGSESAESLLDEDLRYAATDLPEFMQAVFKGNQAAKNQAFLFKPVLVCTIDHMMAATETVRGGKYILPCLRLLSSDLVIDEVDDFNPQDLVAIGRLVHLAGMLGRKVMISSATIPPALAEGFFNVYQQGWHLHCQFKQLTPKVVGMWVDEFNSHISASVPEQEHTLSAYREAHSQFVQARLKQLQQALVKRKALVVKCEQVFDADSDEGKRQQYFELVRAQIEQLHLHHHHVDAKTGKKVSFGVVRVANINPCVLLSRYLINADWGQGFAPKVMAYHSRQILLLRQQQEAYLDAVLNRKRPVNEDVLQNKLIRAHLDDTDAEHVVFVLVATPVEEVGRDHDFDWAVIEPSSLRSIIQLAGRVLRHRQLEAMTPNIALMQYNLRALLQGKNSNKAAFCRPGFEPDGELRLLSHDVCDILNTEQLAHSIDAQVRIQAAAPLQPRQKLADLEHASMQKYLADVEQKGPMALPSWGRDVWFLTGLPQRFNRFRASSANIQLFATVQDGRMVWQERDGYGEYVNRNQTYTVVYEEFGDSQKQRLWLWRDYAQLLEEGVEGSAVDAETAMLRLAHRYGEIMLPDFDKNKELMYSDQFGLSTAMEMEGEVE